MTSYVRRGEGPPLVLVHGLGSRWECWSPVLDLVAAEHDVIAVDLPGFGGTPLPRSVEPGVRGYAAWVADLLAELDVKHPHVVGNSMGGGIALELGRVGIASRATAFSPVGFWEPAGRIWSQLMLTGLRQVGKGISPLLPPLAVTWPGRALLVGSLMGKPSKVPPSDTVLHAHGLIDSVGFVPARDSFSDYYWHPGDDLGALPEIPVTVAWGTRDYVLIHRTQSARARKVLPFARHVDLPGLGHVPFYDDPALCARVILEAGR